MADNLVVTAGTGTNVASDEVTYSGDTAKLGIVRLVHVDGAEGSKTVKELVRLEDAAHTSADPGVPVLGVRQDTAASLAGTDGDYTMPIFDASGRQHVNVGASALPTGASTSAKQDTIIGHLDGVEGILTTMDADTGNISTKIDTLAGAVSGTEMQVDVLTMPTVTVTASNLDVQSGGADLATSTQAGAIQTSVELIDDAIRAEDVASADAHKGMVSMFVRQDTPANSSGTDGDYEIPKMSGGRVWVDASGKTLTVDGSGVTQPVSNAGLTELAAAINASSQMDVNIAASGATVPISHAALTELAAAINSDKLDVNIASGSAAGTEYTEDAAAAANPVGGAVMLVREDGRAGSLTTTDGDNVALRGNNKGEAYVKTTDSDALLTTIDADTSNISTKIDTLAGAVSGTEMQVDVLTMPSVAVTNAGLTELAGAIDTEVQVDIVGALPAGTNAIGKLLPPDIDVTTHTNYAKKYYTNAGAVTDGIVWSPAAGKRWHVCFLYIQVSAAATVTLEDDLAAGDSAVWKAELAANSGISVPFPEKYPLASGEDAADLLITTSAGNVYVTITGYEI